MRSDNQPPRGLVFNIQGHSVHDGPGTRTTVFFAGCPLHCRWCANPEGIYRHPVPMYRRHLCVGCRQCQAACPHQAIAWVGDGLSIDRSACAHCLAQSCAQACLHEALCISGRFYSCEDLLHVLDRDRAFWGGHGGVTFSGGEPLAQYTFVSQMLQRCKRKFMHTCIETSGHVPTDHFMAVMPDVDWVFMDIKHMQSDQHRRLTGVDNRLILNNLEILVHADWDGFVVPRLPLVPGMNDDEDNIRATARFVKHSGLELLHILPFHRLGESKYRHLGMAWPLADIATPTPQQLQTAQAIVEGEGLVCYTGSDTPF